MIARYFLLACGLLCLLSSSDAVTTESTEEELLRAAIIERIAGFIEWPPPATATAAAPVSPLSICVTPEHPQLIALRSYYGADTATPPAAVVVVHKRFDTGSRCRVLFLAARDIASAAELARLRTLAEREHILLIAEGQTVARDGVHVGFYVDKGRTRLEVNRKSLEAAGLKASFRLLDMARIVGR